MRGFSRFQELTLHRLNPEGLEMNMYWSYRQNVDAFVALRKSKDKSKIS